MVTDNSIAIRVGFTTLEREHKNMLKRADQVYTDLNNLSFEGKVSYKKNLKTIADHIKHIKEDVYPHINIEENVLFEFLKIHIPRINSTIEFLRGDHKEFIDAFESFESLFLELQRKNNEIHHQVLLDQLKNKGIYLICLMRNHIRMEAESVYTVIENELHSQEKYALYKQINKHMMHAKL